MGWHQGHGFALQAKAMAKRTQKVNVHTKNIFFSWPEQL
jgi:hypothetical protein